MILVWSTWRSKTRITSSTASKALWHHCWGWRNTLFQDKVGMVLWNFKDAFVNATIRTWSPQKIWSSAPRDTERPTLPAHSAHLWSKSPIRQGHRRFYPTQRKREEIHNVCHAHFPFLFKGNWHHYDPRSHLHILAIKCPHWKHNEKGQTIFGLFSVARARCCHILCMRNAIVNTLQLLLPLRKQIKETCRRPPLPIQQWRKSPPTMAPSSTSPK